MSDRDIPSKKVVLEVLIDGTYFPVFCAQSGSHDLEQEEIEVTSVNSGSDKEFVPGMASSSVRFAGLTRVDNSDGKVSILYLMQQSVRRQIRTWRMTLMDDVTPVNGTATLTFQGFIRATNYDKNDGNLSKCFVDIRITGAITHGSVIVPPVDPECEIAAPLYLTMAEGETSVSDPLLEQTIDRDVEILLVSRSGTGLDEVFGTPAAGTREFFYDSGAGEIQVDATNPANPGGEVIYVLYKVIQ